MSVLVLNAAYEPINITTPQKAMVMMYKGVAESIEKSDVYWRTPHTEVNVPSVIRIVGFARYPKRYFKLSKRNVHIRDKHMCQYCGKTFSCHTLTVDHIIPKSKGGKSSWENLVAACRRCNAYKGDRTPEEAGLILLAKRLTPLSYQSVLSTKAKTKPEWSKYVI